MQVGTSGCTSAAGARKVRCGPATLLQLRLPSNGPHCNPNSQPYLSVRARLCQAEVSSRTSLAGFTALPCRAHQFSYAVVIPVVLVWHVDSQNFC